MKMNKKTKTITNKSDKNVSKLSKKNKSKKNKNQPTKPTKIKKPQNNNNIYNSNNEHFRNKSDNTSVSPSLINSAASPVDHKASLSLTEIDYNNINNINPDLYMNIKLAPIPPSPNKNNNNNHNTTIITNNGIVGLNELTKDVKKKRKINDSEILLNKLLNKIELILNYVKRNNNIYNINNVQLMYNFCIRINDFIINELNIESNIIILPKYLKEILHKFVLDIKDATKLIKKLTQLFHVNNAKDTKRKQITRITTEIKTFYENINYDWEIILTSLLNLNEINNACDHNIKLIKFWLNLFPHKTLNFVSVPWYNFILYLTNHNKLFTNYNDNINQILIILKKSNEILFFEKLVIYIEQHKTLDLFFKNMSKYIKNELKKLKKHNNYNKKQKRDSFFNSDDDSSIENRKKTSNSDEEQKIVNYEGKDHIYINELKKENFILRNKVNRLNKNSAVLFELQS